jgi:hypothetical protein
MLAFLSLSPSRSTAASAPRTRSIPAPWTPLTLLAALSLVLLALFPRPTSAKGPADRVSVEEGMFTTANLTRAVGPLYYAGHIIDDDATGNSVGDNDDLVEPGETIELYVDIGNAGTQTATSVGVNISTTNPYVTFLFNTSASYGDIVSGAIVRNENDFDFAVDTSTPIGEEILFILNISATNGGPWVDSLVIVVAHDDPSVALVSDQTELVPVSLDINDIGFETTSFTDNWDGVSASFTSSLMALMQFDVVVWYGSGFTSGRLTTPAEIAALEGYLEAGGRLLVTGYDTIGSPDDSLLAELVRSTTVGDGPFESFYTVFDPGHPIANGRWGSFPGGYGLMAAHSDHDYVHADAARGAFPVARFPSGADKIIATDIDPAPASGRIVYWNGNLEARDWLGPPPAPVARIVEREAKPGLPSNEALRDKAIAVTGADLPAAANAAPDVIGLALDEETLATLRPATTGLRAATEHVFPSAAATYTLGSPPYWYNAGDNATETLYTALDVAERGFLHLVISENYLSGATVDMELSINGTVVADFSVDPGASLVEVDCWFPGIAGPEYTVVLQETNTVPLGHGAIVIPPDLSYLTLTRSQHELFRNALAWLGDGATRRDANEVNDTPEQCTPITFGVPMTNVYIDPAGDWDYYCFFANADDGLFADVDADAIGSALDPVLELFESGGTLVAWSDDVHGLDPFLTYVAPVSGIYYLRVRSYGHPCCGGGDYFYELLVDLGPVDTPEIAEASGLIVPGIETVSPLPAAGPFSIMYGVTQGGLPHCLAVYDVAGRLVRTLVSGPSAVGRHRMIWDGRGGDGGIATSGVYFVSLKVGEDRWTEKIMLLR